MKALATDSNGLLARDIAALATEARHLKLLLGTRWTRPMADEQRRRAVLRVQLTELHVTLAYGRGRLHRTTPPRGACAEWDARGAAALVAGRVLTRYAAIQPSTSAIAPGAREAAAAGAAAAEGGQ